MSIYVIYIYILFIFLYYSFTYCIYYLCNLIFFEIFKEASLYRRLMYQKNIFDTYRYIFFFLYFNLLSFNFLTI